MKTVPISYFVIHALFIINFVVIDADDDDSLPVYFNTNCTTTRNFSSNSPYQITLTRLLISLSSHVTDDDNDTSSFYNATEQVAAATVSTIYAVYMCRGDVPF